KGASWPTGQRHTCRLVRYGELLSCYGSGAPRPARRRIGRAGTCHDQGGALIMTKMNRTSRRGAWVGPAKKREGASKKMNGGLGGLVKPKTPHKYSDRQRAET